VWAPAASRASGARSVVETLGPETCVFFDVGPTVLCARMDRARRLDVGATVRLSVPHSAIRRIGRPVVGVRMTIKRATREWPARRRFAASRPAADAPPRTAM
jgi:hypothetical protein